MELNLKKDFPILNQNIVYLDSAASAQKPQVVIDCIQTHLKKSYANINRGVYSLSEASTKLYSEAREKVADFIGSKLSSNIIFTRNATESINLIAYSLGREIVKEGDEILLTIMEHHSNIVPWQQLAEEKKAVVKFVDVDKLTFQLDMKDLKQKLNNKTKIVAFTMSSNVTGALTNTKEIVQLSKEFGAVTICDGAQMVPHHKVNVNELGMDFMVFSGHKMMSADGIGVLYGKKEKLEKMKPFLFGGDMIESVTVEKTTFAELPEKFEAGTPNMTGAISLKVAIDYIESIGLNRIRDYEIKLNKYAVSKLKKLGYIDFFINTSNIQNGILAFNIKGVHPHDAATIMAEDGVCVRAGQHCAAPLIDFLGTNAVLRASFYLYNDFLDVDKLVESCMKAKELFTI